MDWAFWIKAWQEGFCFHKINTFVATNRLHGDAKTVVGGIGKYKEGLALFRQNNTWCFNRIYYFIYIVLLKTKNVPLLTKIVTSLIFAGKKMRIELINRFKQY